LVLSETPRFPSSAWLDQRSRYGITSPLPPSALPTASGIAGIASAFTRFAERNRAWRDTTF